MADNYLITGYHGTPHVTAENDRGIYAGIFGAGRFVLPVGEKFRAEYIGNNTVRVYDGKLIDNGAAAGIPAGKYVDLTISEAAQGMKRNDLIVFQYRKDTATLVESGSFVVVKGTETAGTAKDPTLTQADLLSDEATLDQMPLWRVPVSTATISTPVQVFELHGLTEVDNTPDSEKYVAYAQRAGSADQTKYGLTIRANGGRTENTDQWTYDGSVSKAVNITPEKIGAAEKEHYHYCNQGVTTAGTGAAYTAQVDGIKELVAGVSFIMIPHTASTSASCTLNVNGLGAKLIRRNLSDNSITTVASASDDWLGANKPVRVMYNGTYWIADYNRPKATDLYGTLPIELGGTGATTREAARTALGIASGLTCNLVWSKLSDLAAGEQTATFTGKENTVFFIVEFRVAGLNYNDNMNFCEIVFPGTTAFVTRTRFADGKNHFYERKVTANSNASITFDICYEDGTTKANYMLAPVRVYAVSVAGQ